MSRTAVVDNYAETALELATREGSVGAYGAWLDELGALYRNERDFRLFLDTPRVSLEEKKAALRDTLADAPETFVRFVLVTLDKGRHRLLPHIQERYREMVDEREDRVHATVTLTEEPDDELRDEIRRRLTTAVGRDVVPHFRVDEAILGGIVVRVDDRVMDGSLRRRLQGLRRRMVRSADGSAG